MRLTIGKKLNSLIIGLLLLGIGSTTLFALVIYTSDLSALLQKSTLDTSSIIARNVQAEMKHIAEWSRTLASASLEDFRYNEDRVKFIQQNLGYDDQYVAIAVYQEENQTFPVTWRILHPELSQKVQLTTADFSAIDEKYPLNFPAAQKGQIDFSLAQLPNGTPLVRMLLPFVQKADKTFSQFIVVDLQQEKLTSVFSELTNGTSTLVDRNGVIIGSSNIKQIPLGKNVSQLALFQDYTSSRAKKKQLNFTDDRNDVQIAAYQEVGFANLLVVTQIPERVAKEQEAVLVRRSTFLAAVFLCLALTFGFLYSQTITTPIRALETAAEKVKTGDFSVRLTAKKTGQSRGDEIQKFSETFNEMVEGLQERDRIKTTFSKFHSKEIADKLLSGEVALGGERLNASVFFSDIRGFTSTSEKLEAEVLVQILNRYMSRMVQIITDHGGVVDKYVGDAIMAVWGVPISKPDDVNQSVMAALKMRKELDRLNDEFIDEGLPTLKIGMGLNYGPVVAGNIGSEERMEYTVIGDTVNTASRIEALTKSVGCDLLISQSVLNHTNGKFLVEKLTESIKLKGKKTQIAVYKVDGYTDTRGEEVRIETSYSNYDAEAGKPTVNRNPQNLPPPIEYTNTTDEEVLNLEDYADDDDDAA